QSCMKRAIKSCLVRLCATMMPQSSDRSKLEVSSRFL
ncbi:hypothetical protein Anapl_02407, partial [Anas platyrhynchos]